MPTGAALHNVRGRLFDAAERVVLRDGVNALTSRAVTAEARCAKGVLHRHFADFDTFLAEFVLGHITQIHNQAAALHESAGTSTVVDNLTDALRDLFGSVAAAIVPLVTSRNELRARLRHSKRAGIPILADGADMIASYLAAERELGRITADADVETLALMLIGTGHLLFANRKEAPSEAGKVRKVVTSVIAGVVLDPQS